MAVAELQTANLVNLPLLVAPLLASSSTAKQVSERERGLHHGVFLAVTPAGAECALLFSRAHFPHQLDCAFQSSRVYTQSRTLSAKIGLQSQRRASIACAMAAKVAVKDLQGSALSPSPPSPPFVKVASVSYEGSVFGWDVAPATGSEASLEATMTYGFHCSTGSLKVLAVSASGKYMCCGGTDERIHIFDVENKRAVGEIAGHTGAVTCLTFIGDTNLLSGSDDSTLCIWRVYDWQCLHILGGHKLGVNGIAVHPSGKLALSVSKDNTLKTWNLVHGRCAFTRRLKGPADKVLWNAAGDYYLLVIGSDLQIYSAEDSTSCAASFSFGSRINQAVFTSTGDSAAIHAAVAVICDNKMLHVVDLSGKKFTAEGVDLSAVLDDGRPRDMWSCQPAVVGTEDMQEILQEEGHCLSVVTSNGLLVVLSCRTLCHLDAENGDDVSHALLSSMQITAQPRLTAVVSWVPSIKEDKQARAPKRSQDDTARQDDVDDGKKRVKFAPAEKESDSSTTKGKTEGKKGKKKGKKGGKKGKDDA